MQIEKSNHQLFELPLRVPRSMLQHLPPLSGHRIRVRVQPDLTSLGGKLVSGVGRGAAVHAGLFMRKRVIVLEEALLRFPRRLNRIFIHEVFHFAWLRLGNHERRQYEQLLEAEIRLGAKGELGWSAESLKETLTPTDVRRRTVRWRAYACESFCDTAGWMFGNSGPYAEMTLRKRFRDRRRVWLFKICQGDAVSI
jgi:hypothetical protein